MTAPRRAAKKRRKRGGWEYGVHDGLNPGWRLRDTGLVLDFDPFDNQSSLRGAYVLWVDGREGPSIDHYLDAAMSYVEDNESKFTSDVGGDK